MGGTEAEPEFRGRDQTSLVQARSCGARGESLLISAERGADRADRSTC